MNVSGLGGGGMLVWRGVGRAFRTGINIGTFGRFRYLHDYIGTFLSFSNMQRFFHDMIWFDLIVYVGYSSQTMASELGMHNLLQSCMMVPSRTAGVGMVYNIGGPATRALLDISSGGP